MPPSNLLAAAADAVAGAAVLPPKVRVSWLNVLNTILFISSSTSVHRHQQSQQSSTKEGMLPTYIYLVRNDVKGRSRRRRRRICFHQKRLLRCCCTIHSSFMASFDQWQQQQRKRNVAEPLATESTREDTSFRIRKMQCQPFRPLWFTCMLC